MKKQLLAAAAALALTGSLTTAVALDDTTTLAKHRSWGYEGDGGNQLPDYPVEESESVVTDVQQVGRTNPHSGGRTRNHANKRHGGGGHGRNSPVSDTTTVCTIPTPGAHPTCETVPVIAGSAGIELPVLTGTVTVEPVRVRSSRGKPAGARPGGRPGCCRVDKNFRRT